MTTENYDMWLIEHWKQRAVKAEAALATQSPAPQAEAAEPVERCFEFWYGDRKITLYPDACEGDEPVLLKVWGPHIQDDMECIPLTNKPAVQAAFDWLYAAPPLPQRQEAAQVEASLPVHLPHVGDMNCKGTPKCLVSDSAGLAASARALIAALDQPFKYPGEIKAARDRLEAALATPPASSRVAAPTTQAVKVPLTDVAEHWMHKAHEFQAERDDLRHLLDNRPALNADTLNAYREWTGKVYAADAHRALARQQEPKQ